MMSIVETFAYILDELTNILALDVKYNARLKLYYHLKLPTSAI